MTSGRKLYYAPGVISLIGYFFLLPYAYNKSVSKPVTVINFIVPKLPTRKNDYGYVLSEGWILDDIKNKKKIKFWLNDDHEINQEKIDFIRFEAIKLKYTLDSSSVIFIEFTDDLLYEELFRIYDNCITDKIQRFATWDNYFVIFGGYPPPKKDTSDFVPMHICTTGVIQHEQQMLRKKKEERLFKIKRFTQKKSLYLFGGWLAVLISFLYFRKIY